MEKGSAKKALHGAGNFILENKKPILIIGGAMLVGVVSVIIVKGVKTGVGSIFKFGADVKGNTPFSTLETDASKTTISDNQSEIYANHLFNAMKDSGTDTSVIESIFDKISADDYKKIYNSFKRRSYFNFGEPTLLSWVFGYSDLDLNEWLKKEVSFVGNPFVYQKIKKKINEAGMAF